MKNLVTMKAAIIKVAGRSGLVLKKYSPEILITVGVVGVVASAVMACKATLKADEVIDKAQQKINRVKYAKDNYSRTAYTEQDYLKDMTIAYAQTGFEFIKLYGPAITLGVASIACILGAHNIMSKRNVALVTIYKAVEQSFSDYRKRVVEEFGENKDRQFKYGIREEIVEETITDENGKKKKVKQTVEVVDPNAHSVYARFFDEASTQWNKTPEYNHVFLKCQQNYANDLLHARGNIFLNEIYDMLGIPRSQAGAIVGWVTGKGDNFVDFGMYDLNNEAGRDFVNGYERSILLDFNVDGVIYDML